MNKYYLANTITKVLCFMLLAAVALTVYSCRKNLAADTGTINPNAFVIDLNALKLNYTNDTLAAKTGATALSTASGTTAKLIRNLHVQWDKVYYAKRADGSRLMEFDMQSNPRNTAPALPNTTVYHYQDKTSLVFLQFEKTRGCAFS